MSDERLRELERRWKETGAVEDEAAYLLERVRVGDLTQERLELAAYCGHEAALHATGGSTHAPLDSINRWVDGLEPWGQAVLVRAAVGAARFVYPVWVSKLRGRANGEWVTEALRAAERWVLEPSAEAASEARDRASDAFAAPDEANVGGSERASAEACAFASRAAGSGDSTDAKAAVREAVSAEEQQSVRAAIAEELVMWAIGREDPLARWRT